MTSDLRENSAVGMRLSTNVEITEILNRLSSLGVESVSCVTSLEPPYDSPCTMALIPHLRKAARISASRLDDVRMLAWRLGDLVGYAVPEVVEGTAAEGLGLWVKMKAVMATAGGPHTFVAEVAVMGVWDPCIARYRIELP